MTRVETMGSIWMLDDDNQRYARMPKTEGPRWSPEGEDWGGPGAGALEDLTWHEMTGWRIKNEEIRVLDIEALLDDRPAEWIGSGQYQSILVIAVPGDDRVVIAPDAVVVS